jgi:murein DD-endopeptidase MepM/ murein hydrolase activator NlpD
MRSFTRIVALLSLLLVVQLATAYSGSAQIDPCHPIVIPELCEDEPLPTPPPPPGGGGENDGGGGGGGGGGLPDPGTPSNDNNGGPIKNPTAGNKPGGGAKPNGGRTNGKGLNTVPTAPQGPFVFGGSNDTSRLIQILSKLKPYGVSVREALLRVVGPFPVAGPSYWTNDWHACRDGCTRFHEGLDMFAPTGTPLVAIADGVVTQKVVGELSGISVEIQDAHGVQYFYAHLSDWAPGLRAGQRVEQGDVLGYIGNTGNAIYTAPHLHLEVQPGGVPVPPKPHVDEWLKVAEREAIVLVTGRTGQPLAELVGGSSSDFRLTRLFDLAGGAGKPAAGGQELLTLLGIQPSVSSMDITSRWLGQMAWEIDWASQSDAQLAALAEEYGGVAARDLSGASPWAPFGSQRNLGNAVPSEVGD